MTIEVLSFYRLIPVSHSEVVAVLGFYRNYAAGGWYTGHFWSLAIEEHFYLVVPLVVAFCSTRRALQIAGAAILICVVIRAIEWALLPTMKVEFRTESRFDALMWGAVFAMLMHQEHSRRWLAAKLNGWVALATLVIAMVLLLVLPQMPIRRTVVAFALPVILGYTVLRPRELLGTLLELPWLRFIGRISYSLYIWQMLFFVPFTPDMPMVQSFPTALIFTVSCALASYYLIEQPAVKWARRSRGREFRKLSA